MRTRRARGSFCKYVGHSVDAEAQSSLAQLFGSDDAALSELQEAVENDRD